MAAPQTGEAFVDFTVGSIDTSDLRSRGLLLVLIWQRDCPVCRMALPYFQRLALRYPSISVVGVAQDAPEVVDLYVKTEGISFAQVSDQDLHISRAYDVQIVPAYWLTDAEGRVLIAGTGWNRQSLEEIAIRAAGIAGVAAKPLVLPTDGVPDFRPG